MKNTTPQQDHDRATPYKPESEPIKPIEAVSVFIALVIGLCSALIAISPVIVAWLQGISK